MKDADVRRLGVILAIQARIESMKLDNQLRIMNNQSPSYSPEDIMDESERLKTVAGMADHDIIFFAIESRY